MLASCATGSYRLVVWFRDGFEPWRPSGASGRCCGWLLCSDEVVDGGSRRGLIGCVEALGGWNGRSVKQGAPAGGWLGGGLLPVVREMPRWLARLVVGWRCCQGDSPFAMADLVLWG